MKLKYDPNLNLFLTMLPKIHNGVAAALPEVVGASLSPINCYLPIAIARQLERMEIVGNAEASSLCICPLLHEQEKRHLSKYNLI
jgi:hypothetical protein